MSKTSVKQPASSSLLLRLPPDLLMRFRSLVPARQRTGVIALLVQYEVERRELELEKVARLVEADDALNDEMSAWDSTIEDGIEEHVPTYDEAR